MPVVGKSIMNNRSINPMPADEYSSVESARCQTFFSIRISVTALYWQQVRFGLKPTVRINHVVMMDEADRLIVASKQLYASHYFWTELELRVLIPDQSRGQGFWFVSLNRARSDGLTGFVGGLIRGRIRKEALKGLTEGLRVTQSKLQRK
jgi:hypothetical protein